MRILTKGNINMTNAFTCTRLMFELHPVLIWLTTVSNKNMTVAYSCLESDHGLTMESAQVYLLWDNKYKLRIKVPKPMSTSKDTVS